MKIALSHLSPDVRCLPMCAKLSVALGGLLLTLAHVAWSQEFQFEFDPRGNLLVQAAEIISSPQILAPPQAQVVVPGALASFFVVAADTRQLIYQWQFNGTNISGATNDALLLQNVGAAAEGFYSVVLANSSGSVTSAPAALMLDADGDGLPDSWELTYFGNLTNTTTGDFDGDGDANLTEFLVGTDPADSASVLFRLTVVNDGGQVTVNPSRFSFTNGEIVTLTATAIAPGTFHGWTGDTNTTNPTISLAMTTNKSVFAHLGTYDLTWTNKASGDWNIASNWSPNYAPGTNDNVFITSGVTVTLNSNTGCGSLTLSAAPTLTGSGTLMLHRNSSWSSGTMTGSGRTVIAPGATLDINGAGTKTLSGGRILEIGGTATWSAGIIQAAAATVITNRAGGLFQVQAAGTITPGAGGGRFDNAGTFRKTSTGTTTINNLVSFNNYSTVELQGGTVALAGGGLNNGTMDVAAGTTLNLSGGTFTSSAGASVAGAGNLTVSGAVANLAGLVNVSGTNTFASSTANLTGNYICTNNTLVISGGTGNFIGTGTLAPAILNFSSGALNGNQSVTVLTQMTWSAGTMNGSARTLIAPGATLDLNGAGTKTLSGGRILEIGGTATWSAGIIQAATATLITNRSGALFQVQSAAGVTPGAGGGRFDNAGTFRKTSEGTTTFNSPVSFNNYGTVEIRSGIVAANGGYTSSSGGLLNCALGGTTVGTGYGRLQVAGSVTLNGALSVDLINGFVPSVGDSFTILTAGTRSGTFTNFSYPSNAVTMQLSNTVNSVIARVTDILVVPQPVLLQPELSGPDIRLIWTAISNITYRLEFNPDLSPANWNALPGDVFSLSNTASKLDTLTSSNRFYRVRVLP